MDSRLPLSTTQMPPKALLFNNTLSGIRAPLTVDESDYENSASSNSHRNSPTGSYYSGSELEYDEYESEKDEEIVEETHFVKEYAIPVPFAKNPVVEIVQESSSSDKNGFFRAYVKNPDGEIVGKSGDSRPVVGFKNTEISENVSSNSVVKIGVSSIPILHIPVAKVSGDSDDDSIGSEISEDDGLFSGVARIPSVEILQRFNIPPKVRIVEIEEEGENELQTENTFGTEFVKDLVDVDEEEHIIPDDVIQGNGTDANGEFGDSSLVVNEYNFVPESNDLIQENGTEPNGEFADGSLVVNGYSFVAKSDDLTRENGSDSNGEFADSSLVVNGYDFVPESEEKLDLMRLDEEIQEINVLEDTMSPFSESEAIELGSGSEFVEASMDISNIENDKLEDKSTKRINQAIEIKKMMEDSIQFLESPDAVIEKEEVDTRKTINEGQNSQKLPLEVEDSTSQEIAVQFVTTDEEANFSLEKDSKKLALSELEKKEMEKIHEARMKFIRFLNGSGKASEDSLAAKVLEHLKLADSRYSSREFNSDSSENVCKDLEIQSQNDLNLTILVIGKTGVGKSATINSILGEKKTVINPFEPATREVKEIICSTNGVKFKIFDTPGLRISGVDQFINRKILLSIKKMMKKSPPDVVLYVDRLDMEIGSFNDLPLLKLITNFLGSSIWQKTIFALTHATSVHSEGVNGDSYETFIDNKLRVFQVMDRDLNIPVALVENHQPKVNEKLEKVVHNGESWKSELLLLCYSMKNLSEVNFMIARPLCSGKEAANWANLEFHSKGNDYRSQFCVWRNLKLHFQGDLNDKLSWCVSVKYNGSYQLQIALLAIATIANAIFKKFFPNAEDHGK